MNIVNSQGFAWLANITADEICRTEANEGDGKRVGVVWMLSIVGHSGLRLERSGEHNQK